MARHGVGQGHPGVGMSLRAQKDNRQGTAQAHLLGRDQRLLGVVILNSKGNSHAVPYNRQLRHVASSVWGYCPVAGDMVVVEEHHNHVHLTQIPCFAVASQMIFLVAGWEDRCGLATVHGKVIQCNPGLERERERQRETYARRSCTFIQRVVEGLLRNGPLMSVRLQGDCGAIHRLRDVTCDGGDVWCVGSSGLLSNIVLRCREVHI